MASLLVRLLLCLVVARVLVPGPQHAAVASGAGLFMATICGTETAQRAPVEGPAQPATVDCDHCPCLPNQVAPPLAAAPAVPRPLLNPSARTRAPPSLAMPLPAIARGFHARGPPALA